MTSTDDIIGIRSVSGHLENATFDPAAQSFTGGHSVADEPVDLHRSS